MARRAPTSNPTTDVLIAGAGPTGLVLALWLTRLGVRVRIVDKTAEPGTTSRALVVQARTLEAYRQIGLADEVVAKGVRFGGVNLWAAGRKAAHVSLGDIGKGLSPFPFATIFPQDEHELLLIEHLAAAGVTVERGVSLTGFDERGGHVRARLRGADGAEAVCDAAWLAGCDGARSAVREASGADFPGGTYAQMFYVADVEASGPVVDGELHIALDDADFLGAFPMKGARRVRLIGMVSEAPEGGEDDVAWKDVSGGVGARLGLKVRKVNWFSTYRVHHRVAGSFRHGRAFLLGDAAHIHSPVGGQGMNTGIGDAINLAWKLAAVVQRRGDEALLDTYEPERIAFARRLVATTDRAFTVATSPGPIARLVRLDVMPRLLPALIGMDIVRRLMFRTVSQTAVEYRDSALSAGGAGRVQGGDRLPWVTLEHGGDNFAPLAELDWQVHIYGEPAPALIEACVARRLKLHAFDWRPSFWRAGLLPGALYLVRPDGYVAVADPNANPAALANYLDRWAVKPRTAATPAPARPARAKPAPAKAAAPEPAAKKPVTGKPAAKTPVAKKPVAKKPVAKRPISKPADKAAPRKRAAKPKPPS